VDDHFLDPAKLEPTNRELLRDWEELLEMTWTERRLDELYQRLPESPNVLRPYLLQCLVLRDMALHKAGGKKVTALVYAADRLPELRRHPQILARLVALEEKLWPLSDAAVDTDKEEIASASLKTLEELPEYFGRYKRVRKLGEGAMGKVYLVRDTAIDREVVLKIPRLDADDGTAFRERLRNEAKAAAQLNHPNICRLIHYEEIAGVPHLTMDYIEGETLESRFPPGVQAAPDEARRLVAKLGRAIHAAHDKGIVHRDLKPANIMMTPEGEPVILDFGLAKRLQKTSAYQTQPGALVGTPVYMSYEQISGDVVSTGPHSDVYSLGVILYQLLSGRVPFDGMDTIGVLAKVLTREPDPPSRHCPGLNPKLEAVCLKAFAKNIKDRYPTGLELAEALEAIDLDPGPDSPPDDIGEDPTTVDPPQGVLARLSTSWRHRIWLTATAAAACGLLAGLGLVLMPNKGGKADENGGLDSRTVDVTTWRLVQTLSGHTDSVWTAALTPDGRRAASGGHDGSTRLWDVGTGKALATWRRGSGRVRCVAFSSTGTRVVAGGTDGRIALWDCDDDLKRVEPWHTFEPLPQAVVHLACAADGRILAACANETLWLWEGDVGKGLRQLDGPTGWLRCAGFLSGNRAVTGGPDGLLRLWGLQGQSSLPPSPVKGLPPIWALAVDAGGNRVLTGGADGTIHLWDPAGDRPTRLPDKHTARVWGVTLSGDGRWAASGDERGQGYVWDLLDLRPVGEFRHEGAIHAVAITSDGTTVLAAGDGKDLRVWQRPP
jgi:serine/threonine protein kinase